MLQRIYFHIKNFITIENQFESNQMKKILLSFLLSSLGTVSWAQTYLSPNAIGGGNLPANVPDMIFSMYDGNWARFINLPATSLNGAKVKLVTEASYTASVILTNTDIPSYSMDLPRDRALSFTYSAATKLWEMDAFTVPVPNSYKSLELPVTQNQVIRANVLNGAWTPQVILPASAVDNAVVLIKSRAAWASSVATTNMLFAQKMPLRNGEEYAFTYRSGLGKWVLSKGPKTVLNWGTVKNFKMPNTTRPWTSLEVPSRVVGGVISLPLRASERDRVIVTSSAEAPSTIANSNVKDQATMKIIKGQLYEFMWNNKVMAWERLKAPQAQFTLNSLPSDALPATLTPVTEVVALEGTGAKTAMTLPNFSTDGDRVIVKSTAPGLLTVYGVIAGMTGNNTVSQGEEVSFIRKGGQWTRETYTVRMLIVAGQSAIANIGAAAMQSRLTESLRKTNSALELSGANFRVQAAGFSEFSELQAGHGETLSNMRTDPAIQTERDRVSADAVYMEGKFVSTDACGLAFVNSPVTGFSFNMAAVGNAGCGTSVMVHEFGHNMGLNHNGGYISTVMGNADAATHFTTTRKFSTDLGIEIGHGAPIPDEVLLMNKNADEVSRIR